MKEFNKGDTVYWARIVPSCDLYEVEELKLRTVEDTYAVGIEKHTKQAFLFNYTDIDKCIFFDRISALRRVQIAESSRDEE